MVDIAALDPRSRDLVIRTIIGEAGGESDAGRAAVASVIRNRMLAGRYGGSTGADVVLAKGQFEPWMRDDARARMMGVSTDSPLYGRIGGIVDRTFSGELPDETKGATHFFSPKVQAQLGRDAPAWGRGAPIVQIGTHSFYAPEGAVSPPAGTQSISTGAAPAPAQPGALDNLAMGQTPSGAPVGGGMPMDIAAAAAGAPGGSDASGGSNQLGMLAGALGSLGGVAGKQQAPQIKPSEPMAMPIPVGMRNSLVAAILQRGGVA